MTNPAEPRRGGASNRERASNGVQRPDLPARATAVAIVTLLLLTMLAAAAANPGSGAVACLLAAVVAALCAFLCLQPLLRRG